jgi:SAM-dependent methyltransferase
MLYAKVMTADPTAITPDSSELFDRRARRIRRNRAVTSFARHSFLKDAMVDDVCARLVETGSSFSRVLDLGGHDGRLGARIHADFTVTVEASAAFARTAPRPALVADEDRLPFADASFDLIASAGSLHSVNDLPGALIQARRALRPGGLFVAAFFAGETLRDLRHDLIAAEDSLTGRVSPRVAPMVDLQAGAGLLQRAGFAAAVADVDTLTVRYASLFDLLADLRGMGEANVLASRVPLRRDVLADVAARFAARSMPDGKVAVPVQIVTLTGWAPPLGESTRTG